MDFGQRLRQARLEAGLSQRELCGSEITRNMLSQIENGSARPSMDTLRYLAGRLGKPISFFLEEDAVLSPNQPLIDRARQSYSKQQFDAVLQVLGAYRTPDPVFDAEAGLLKMLALLELAETAVGENRLPYARELLAQAEQAGSTTCYLTGELTRRRLLLLAEAQPEYRDGILTALPAEDRELLLRAEAALGRKDYALCRSLLDTAADKSGSRWNFLRGEAAFGLGAPSEAVPFYRLAETAYPAKVVPRLEQCYLQLENYKMAYLYACKQREQK